MLALAKREDPSGVCAALFDILGHRFVSLPTVHGCWNSRACSAATCWIWTFKTSEGVTPPSAVSSRNLTSPARSDSAYGKTAIIIIRPAEEPVKTEYYERLLLIEIKARAGASRQRIKCGRRVQAGIGAPCRSTAFAKANTQAVKAVSSIARASSVIVNFNDLPIVSERTSPGYPRSHRSEKHLEEMILLGPDYFNRGFGPRKVFFHWMVEALVSLDHGLAIVSRFWSLCCAQSTTRFTKAACTKFHYLDSGRTTCQTVRSLPLCITRSLKGGFCERLRTAQENVSTRRTRKRNRVIAESPRCYRPEL